MPSRNHAKPALPLAAIRSSRSPACRLAALGILTATLGGATRATAETPVKPDQALIAPATKHPTPPRGWNSYTGYSIAVTEAELLKNIDFLAEKLLPHGYDTVTVDNGWFLSGIGEGVAISLDAYGRPESNPHFFPNGLKHTIDHAHKKGVKFGIWLLRGINRRAVDENLPVEGTNFRMKDIVDMKSACSWAAKPWWNYGVDMTKPGAQEYYDGLVKKYADMGVDFIKFDDMVPSPAEVAAAAKAIAKCGRPIILSLSPGDDINVEHSDAYKQANMVRITSDIWDNRGALDTTFRRWEAMQAYSGPEVGSFLDMDMVCFGRLNVVHDDGGWVSHFTADQKRAFMVQRALAASPLMLGGVLYDMDDFSMSLFTHPGILACNSNAVIGRLAHRDGRIDVWKTPERGNPDNGWLGIFNRDGKNAANIELGLKELGLNASAKLVIKDLWTGKTLPAGDQHAFVIPPDGVAFLRYEQASGNAAAAPAGKVIYVTDFGVKPDSGEDAVKGVRAAIEACRKESPVTLVFPKGRYDFRAEHSDQIEYFESNTTDNNPKTCPIVLKGIKGLTLEGNGSEFVYHGRMQPLTFEDCAGITVRNLNLDWDIPFVAQAKIEQVGKDFIDIRINKTESPFDIENGKIVFHGEGWKSGWWGCMEFDSETRIIPQQSGDTPLGGNWDKYTAQELGDGLVRLTCDFQRKPKQGNILIMRHSARDHAGVFLLNCKDTAFENVNLFTSAGLGILAQFCENITLTKTNVMPNYAKGRYQCGHADGFHVSNCRGQILVDGCKFEGLMDDPINVHGTSVRFIERKDPARIVCKFMEGMSTGMTWGRPDDKIGFIDHETMATIGVGVIKGYRQIDRDQFEVVFSDVAPFDLKPGDALENLTWAPDFTARNCWFGSCRARGLLVSTPGKVVVENNDFVSSGAAILIAGDANEWYESGGVKDVLIKGNRFHPSCLTSWYQFGEGIISILPIIPKLDPELPFHRNIRIEGNRFDVFDYSVLYALSVDGLSFKDNIIQHNTQYHPWQGRKAMLTFEGCKNVAVSGNKIADDVLGKNIRTVKMNPAEVAVAPEQGILPPTGDQAGK